MKIDWRGLITSVQPRFRLLRSFDERHHNYLGYALRVLGTFDGENGEAWIGVGPAAHEKHRFEVGQQVHGRAHPVADPRAEPVDFYKVAGVVVEARAGSPVPAPPPWHGIAPRIEIYRERGHRRLAARTWASAACSSCSWGARMPVEIVVDADRKYKPRFRNTSE